MLTPGSRVCKMEGIGSGWGGGHFEKNLQEAGGFDVEGREPSICSQRN